MSGAGWKIFLALWGSVALSAAEPDALPDVLARIDGFPVLKAVVLSQLPPEARQDTAQVRQALDRVIYATVLRQALAEAGIAPDRAETLAYLRKLNRLQPPELPSRDETELLRLADSPEVQLNVAVRRYFETTLPAIASVPETEIRTLYRVNQPRFTRPSQMDLGVIQIEKSRPGAKTLAADVRARLLQGENFDRLARLISPGGATVPAEELLPLLAQSDPNPQPNTVSAVLEDPEHYFVIRIKTAIPARSIPYEELREYLREQIIAKRAGEMTNLLLRREMIRRRVEYRWPPVKRQ